MKIIVCLLAFAALTMADDTDLQAVLRNSNDQFSAKMFSEVVKANPGKNVVMSGFSVLPILGQLSLAAVGESHDELLKATSLPNDNVTKAVFSEVNRGIRAVKGVELKMANNIYLANGLELNDNLSEVYKNVFGSGVQNVDFTKSVETAGTINKWVEDHTNNRIKDLVNKDSLDASTVSVLVNAIYFKGNWKDKFEKERTTDRDFHVSKDKTIKVPTMSGKKNVRYGFIPELDAKMVEIPYEGDEASLLIILPNKIDGITELEEKLKDPKVLQSAEQNMYETEVDLYIPKFKIETTTDLKEVLTNLGVKSIFGRNARLENLLKKFDTPIYVSKATQKAFIEVNEDGAEAAAANAFLMRRTARLKTRHFKADRPFHFILRSNGLVLFNGEFKA